MGAEAHQQFGAQAAQLFGAHAARVAREGELGAGFDRLAFPDYEVAALRDPAQSALDDAAFSRLVGFCPFRLGDLALCEV